MWERAFWTAMGIVLVFASRHRNLRIGPPRSHERPSYPATRAQRVILLFGGLAMIARGALGWFAK
jgi:hypothetical protein